MWRAAITQQSHLKSPVDRPFIYGPVKHAQLTRSMFFCCGLGVFDLVSPRLKPLRNHNLETVVPKTSKKKLRSISKSISNEPLMCLDFFVRLRRLYGWREHGRWWQPDISLDLRKGWVNSENTPLFSFNGGEPVRFCRPRKRGTIMRDWLARSAIRPCRRQLLFNLRKDLKGLKLWLCDDFRKNIQERKRRKKKQKTNVPIIAGRSAGLLNEWFWPI